MPPPFREGALRRGDLAPISVALGASGLNLPTFGGLAHDDQARVIDAIRGSAG
jgi:hypothetical protein